MKKVLLDTCAYSDLLRGTGDDVLEALDRCEAVLFSVIVLGELHAGFRAGRHRQKNMETLHDFLAEDPVTILPVTTETAEVFGEVKSALRKGGTPIPINDVWIAAQCLEHGAVLLTRDLHFRHVPGLRLGLTHD
ncbi:MAG: type II toxin-antitoxin system VapC family toxin [Planctomycetota bacterium]